MSNRVATVLFLLYALAVLAGLMAVPLYLFPST
jgi:hypothetical protein